MLVVVVYDFYGPALGLVLSHLAHVVHQKIKTLEGLHQGRAGNVGFRAALAVPEGQRIGQSRRKRGFDVFAGYKNERLVKSYDISAAHFKPYKIVNDKFVKGLQLEGAPPQRSAINPLTLLVFERQLDYLYHKLRAFGVYIIVRVVQIAEKPLNGLFQFHTGHLSPVAYALGVLHDGGPVASLNRRQS